MYLYRLMQLIIDQNAGFCPGVRKAIQKAEEILAAGTPLYCLGQIVHNEAEIARLETKGMKTARLEDLPTAEAAHILIRAHGEPPETYRKLEDRNLAYTDASCPLVLRLQQRLAEAASRMKAAGGKVLIFGKANHPEVIGLLGHCQGIGMPILHPEEVDDTILQQPLFLCAQTTMDPDAYQALHQALKERKQALGASAEFEVMDTACGFVARRKEKLTVFAKQVDALLFLAGKNSANGQYLFSIAKEANPQSFLLGDPSEITPEMLEGKEIIGISGAASTPPWLLEKAAQRIRALLGIESN